MFVLIVGGAGSGKSEYAEKEAMGLAAQDHSPLLYLATMVPGGREADARIARHRQNRAKRGFFTKERYTDLSGLSLLPRRLLRCDENSLPTVLLEDLGNLLGNEMFLPEGGGPGAVVQGIRHVREQSGNLVVVANEVFSDGRKYASETQGYLWELAHLQRELAEQADAVVEVVCGQPNIIK